jgi:hypothetical protein
MPYKLLPPSKSGIYHLRFYWHSLISYVDNTRYVRTTRDNARDTHENSMCDTRENGTRDDHRCLMWQTSMKTMWTVWWMGSFIISHSYQFCFMGISCSIFVTPGFVSQTECVPYTCQDQKTHVHSDYIIGHHHTLLKVNSRNSTLLHKRCPRHPHSHYLT